MPSPIIPVVFFKFLFCQWQWGPQFILLFSNWYIGIPIMWYCQKCFLILSEKLAILLLYIHRQLMFGFISLHSASLVPNNSFIMLVNIVLFQHYSCQICNLLFSKLCQHNRLRPNSYHKTWIAINIELLLCFVVCSTSYQQKINNTKYCHNIWHRESIQDLH